MDDEDGWKGIYQKDAWRRKVEAAGFRAIFYPWDKTVFSVPALPKPAIEPPVFLPPVPRRDTLRP